MEEVEERLGAWGLGFRIPIVLWLGSVILKSRRSNKGVGYEPLGRFRIQGLGFEVHLRLNRGARV